MTNQMDVEIGILYNALDDAIEGMEQMLPYVDEYYAMKHDLLAYIERAKTCLTVAQEAFLS